MRARSTVMFLSIPIVLMSLSVTGCESVATPTLGGPWFAEYIGDRPVIDNSPANILFGEDGQVTGSASCNRFTGAYELSGSELTFGMLASTQRACGEALDDQEQRFFAAIAKVSSWAIEDGLLLLHDEAGEQLFRAATHNSAKVTGTALYRQRIAMPEGAVFEVLLEDVSKMDVAATEIASTRIENPGNVPISFEIAFDPSEIDERMSYSVRATIRVDGALWATTDTHYPVLTRDAGNNVELLLQLTP